MTWTDRDDYEQSLADHHMLLEQQQERVGQTLRWCRRCERWCANAGHRCR